MKVIELKEIFKGLGGDLEVVFKLGEKKSYALTLMEIDCNTRELIFGQDSDVMVSEFKLTVKDVLPLLENINPTYDVLFEDIEDNVELLSINGVDISVWHNKVVIKHNIY